MQSKDPRARQWILEQPYLRVPRAMPVSVLPKYLRQRLNIPSASIELLHKGAFLPLGHTVILHIVIEPLLLQFHSPVDITMLLCSLCLLAFLGAVFIRRVLLLTAVVCSACMRTAVLSGMQSMASASVQDSTGGKGKCQAF